MMTGTAGAVHRSRIINRIITVTNNRSLTNGAERPMSSTHRIPDRISGEMIRTGGPRARSRIRPVSRHTTGTVPVSSRQIMIPTAGFICRSMIISMISTTGPERSMYPPMPMSAVLPATHRAITWTVKPAQPSIWQPISVSISPITIF